MSVVQTRRTISINRALFELVHKVAAKHGESAAEFVSKAIRSRLKANGYRQQLPKQRFDGPAVHGRTNHRGNGRDA